MLRPVAATATAIVVAALLLPACGSASAGEELCADLGNLQPTVDYLAAPPADATVGDVRGALEKIDSTLQAVHDDPDVPDAQDDALLDAKDAYDDAIHGVGDDDAFGPWIGQTAGVARALHDAYAVVRATLVCATASPSAG